MRTLSLLGFFACLFLHYHTKQNEVEQDVLTTKQSSIRKSEPRYIPTKVEKKTENVFPKKLFTHKEKKLERNIAEVTEFEEEIVEDDISQLPWDEIEEGWKSALRDFLYNVDPDKAEEMLAAYLEEKKKYVERVDFSDSESMELTEEFSDSGLIIDSDAREDELERRHVENLKGIFGDHYQQVESLHQEYVESVQYLNRTTTKFSISF